MTNVATGVRALGAGFATILRTPKSLLLGALPALISMMLLLGLLGWLLFASDALAEWLTPFAASWPETASWALRFAIQVAMVVTGALLGAVSFIALTLLIGGPFYEHIAERAEWDSGLYGGGDGAGWLRSLLRGIGDSSRLILVTIAGAVVLFCLGFVPLLGQTVVPVLAALFGAWMLSLEMVGLVFQRRGMSVRERHRLLRANRAATFGFGLPTYLLCLIPPLQLLVVPAGVVGGTLLAHRILGPATTAVRTD